MKLYPAIDLLDGRVVRLHKGDFDAVTDYGGDPAAVAAAYLAQGAEYLHVVDLSGARDGERRQSAAVQSLSNTGLRLQVGGGIRTREEIAAILKAGAERVIIGSLAVREPDTVAAWISEFGPDRIVAAFDVRLEAGIIWPLVAGWTRKGDEPLAALMERYTSSGLRHALVTDVDRDGALQGPNTALYAELCELWPDIAWQASGGVSSLQDLRELKAIGADGAIVGKALFENRFTLGEALACLQSG
jgi:phosphoribosylformimino-5-aminoimidazole carboxamide ribotide isomerase